MKITVLRYSSQSQTTLGALLINGKFECYTLEDCHRDIKIKGHTRIPSGDYPVTVRKEGRHHVKYSKQFADFHQGTLHVRNVPNFKYIMIHIGTKKEDTEGCLLVGQLANNNKIAAGKLTNSTLAYKSFYQKVIESAKEGSLTIEYIDYDEK